jgi:cell division protein ZapE
MPGDSSNFIVEIAIHSTAIFKGTIMNTHELRKNILGQFIQNKYSSDPSQINAIDTICNIVDIRSKPKWRRRNKNICVYLWGDVGCGKTFVLDNFYQNLNTPSKKRIHFHEFLSDIHRQLAKLIGEKNPVEIVASAIAEKTDYLCFDEFHVHDIGDAMIIKTVLSTLLEREVSIIATSNYEPENLCPNKQFHHRFQDSILLIQENFDVVRVGIGVDYRSTEDETGNAHNRNQYYHITSSSQFSLEQAIQEVFNLNLSESTLSGVEINNRILKASLLGDNGVCFEFDDLFNTPRSASDYLIITEKFDVVIIKSFPGLDKQGLDAKYRVLNFIDIAYDRNICMLMSTERRPEDLFGMGKSPSDARRTISRLKQFNSI